MIATRLTDRFGLRHPILSAPMAQAAGGRLAAAVSEAGGLGLLGGGYGDADWLNWERRIAGTSPIGVGFITWALTDAVLGDALAAEPAAVMLSFGDPSPFAGRVLDAGVPLICQVQTRDHAIAALDAGATVLVAQGTEAGGHGATRATMTLVPEIADLLAARAPDTLLLAAGGIADGRGLAAALMLGADGVLVGSRFWASAEALVHPDMLAAAVAATGDGTIRTSAVDVVRGRDWPDGYTARVLRNGFTDRWHDDLPGLAATVETEAPRWAAAWKTGDTTVANAFVGEGAGMIHDAPPVAELMAQMTRQAAHLIGGGWRR